MRETKQIYRQRVTALREQMRRHGIDAYLVMTDDFHGSEYVGDHFKCREYISGFTGSAGTLVVTEDSAGLWTDGRYFIQAQEQLEGTGVTLFKMGQPEVPTVNEYLAKNLKDGQCVGYDGRTVMASGAGRLKKALEDKQIRFCETVDLAGEIWTDRPPLPAGRMWILEDRYTGKARCEKLKELRQKLDAEKADGILIASLDDIAWLYNIRGGDIMYNPVVMAYTVVSGDKAVLYIDPDAADSDTAKELACDGVELRPYFQVYDDIKGLPSGTRLWADADRTKVALISAVPDGAELIDKPSPTALAKAIKNPVEMKNEITAHVQDGVAVTKLIYWIKTHRDTQEFHEGKITELALCERLLELRRRRPGFLEESFAPIIATGAHGAIVHYEPTQETDAPIEDNNLLLMDTGGQYYQGTTDITRTIAVGEPTYEMKKHFTAVLRGNLALGSAKFKYGCTGANLDYLARSPLWELGLDYNHGTGHGVGYLLNVHEGPNSIRLRNADGGVGAVLEEGMITSNEPGFYLEGQYGIRCENLVLCVKGEKTEYGQFMEFKTLTMVPFDTDAILPEMLTQREKAALNEYHEEVFRTLEQYLEPEERKWLYDVTRPI